MRKKAENIYLDIILLPPYDCLGSLGSPTESQRGQGGWPCTPRWSPSRDRKSDGEGRTEDLEDVHFSHLPISSSYFHSCLNTISSVSLSRKPYLTSGTQAGIH